MGRKKEKTRARNKNKKDNSLSEASLRDAFCRANSKSRKLIKIIEKIMFIRNPKNSLIFMLVNFLVIKFLYLDNILRFN